MPNQDPLIEVRDVLVGVAMAVCAGSPDAHDRIGAAIRLAIAARSKDLVAVEMMVAWLADFEAATELEDA